MLTSARRPARATPPRSPAHHLVEDRDRLLAPLKLAERDPLAEERPGDPLAQRRLARTPVPRDHLVVDRDRRLAPLKSAERDPLVEKRKDRSPIEFSVVEPPSERHGLRNYLRQILETV